MAETKVRYVVTVEQDCSIRWKEATRVIEINSYEPAKAIQKALEQIMTDTDYNLWQSDTVSVTCERTA